MRDLTTESDKATLPKELAHEDGTTPSMPAHLICQLERYKTLKQLQDYFDSHQYKGRPDFWTGKRNGDGQVVPLRERAPCIIYPLPRNATRQTVRFMVGEGRWPALKLERNEAEEGEDKGGDASAEAEASDELGLTDDEAKELKRGLDEITRKAALKSWFRRWAERGLASGTGVLIAHFRKGRFAFDLPHARDCWPTFVDGNPENGVESLVWCYRYATQAVEKGRLVSKTYWFRRDIDAQNITNYAPVEFDPSRDPEWKVADVEPHNLGFCPVLWVRNGDPTPADVDGISLYDGLLNEFDALNLALSQRHRGIHHFGTPQPWETGVAPDDGPEADGRKADGYSADDGGAHGAVSAPARRQGPDAMWSYQGPEVKVGLVETTGKAFDVATAHVEDIRSRTLEAMSVVIFSAQDMLKGVADLNAKLLGMLYAPLLALVDDLRDATWGPALLDLYSLCLRMIVAVDGKGLRLRNAPALAKLAARFNVLVQTDATDPDSAAEGEPGTESVWTFPDVELAWGEYFAPGADEMQASILAATSAKDGSLVSNRTAASFVAPFFGVKDVDAELESIQEAADEKADAELDRGVQLSQGQAQAKADAMAAIAKTQPGNAPPGAQGPIK